MAVLEAATSTAWGLWPAGLAAAQPEPILISEPPGPPTRPRSFEVTWNTPAPGRLPLPLRFTRAEALDALNQCRANADRPVLWCLIDRSDVAAIALYDRLTRDWGQGLASLDRQCRSTDDHGLPLAEAERMQRSSRIRVWPGDARRLCPFRVRAALLQGCLPLQAVAEADRPGLLADLPAGLAAFVLAVPADGPLPTPTSGWIDDRLDAGLAVLLAGTLERDLALRGLIGRVG